MEDKIVEDIVVGAIGDFCGGLAAAFVPAVLGASVKRIKEKFSGPESTKALRNAVAAALEDALSSSWDEWSADPGRLADYRKLMISWLGSPTVAGEFRRLLDPNAENSLDVELLRGELEQTGMAPDGLGRESFNGWIGSFVRAFHTSAAQQPALQPFLQLRYLERLAERAEASQDILESQLEIQEQIRDALTQQTALQRLTVEEHVQTREALARIVDSSDSQATKLTSDNANWKAQDTKYRQHLKRQFELLTFRGISPPGRPLSLPLESVYTDLVVIEALSGKPERRGVDERRLFQRLAMNPDDGSMRLELEALRWERKQIEGTTSARREHRCPALEALRGPSYRVAVILGDPGSGKTTLLHACALWAAQQSQLLPIFIPLAAYDDYLRRQQEPSLEQFLATYYDQRRSLSGLAPLFRQVLEDGRAWLLLDGLDEVLDLATRQFVGGQVQAFVDYWGERGNRITVTSRFIGYDEVRLQGNLPHLEMQNFGREEIASFAQKWCLAYELWQTGQLTSETFQRAKGETDAFLKDVQSNPGIEKLAANPLLLTMLALLRQQVGRLPDRRIELYADYVRVLIRNREDSRSPGARQASVERFDPHQSESHLMLLALWLQMHTASGTARRQDLLNALTEICLRFERPSAVAVSERDRVEARQTAERCLADLKNFAGLLVERGNDAFGFSHLTFQEYYAARALASMDSEQRAQTILPYVHQPRWREVQLLCAAQLGIVDKRRQDCEQFVNIILNAGSSQEELLHRDLFLAATIAAENVGLSAPILDNLSNRLQTLVDATVPAIQKKAERSLAKLAAPLGHRPTISFFMRRLGENAQSWSIIKEHPELILHSSCIVLREHCLALLEQRSSGSPGNYLMALWGLSPLADENVHFRQFCMSRLNHPETNVRNAAMEGIGRCCSNDAEVRRILLDSLSDRQVAGTALRCLIRYSHQTPEVKSKIIHILADSDDKSLQVPTSPNSMNLFCGLRHVALDALAALPVLPGDLADSVILNLKHPNALLRRTAVEALVNIARSNASIRQRLAEQLKDPDFMVQLATIEFLASTIFSAIDIPELLILLLDNSHLAVRAASIRAVAPWLSHHQDLYRKIIAKLTDSNSAIRQEAIKALTPFLEGAPDLRGIIIARLDDQQWGGLNRMVEAVAPLVQDDSELRNRLRNILVSQNSEAASAAALALGIIAQSDVEIREALQEAIKRPDVEEDALWSLAPLAKEYPNVRLMMERLLCGGSSNWKTRLRALLALSPCVHEESVRNIIVGIIQSPVIEDMSSFMREAAIRALAPLCLHDTGVRKTIESCLPDRVLPESDWPYDFGGAARCAAISALAPLVTRDYSLLKKLLKLMDDTTDTKWAIEILVGKAVAPILLGEKNMSRVVSDKLDAHPFAWIGAFHILSECDQAAAILPLIFLKLNSTNTSLRISAFTTLRKFLPRGLPLFSQLIDALEDADAGVQQAAVSLLGHIGRGDKNEYSILRDKLKSPHMNVRLAACQAITDSLPDVDVRETILTLFESANPFIIKDISPYLERWLLRDQELQLALVPWLGVADHGGSSFSPGISDYLSGHLLSYGFAFGTSNSQTLRRALASALGPLLPRNSTLLKNVTALLDAPSWQARQGAAWALAAMPEGLPPLLRTKIISLLDDLRAEESWTERLQVAEILLNDSDHNLNERAIQVIQQALDHGTAPWYVFSTASQVRAKAAQILANIEPLYQNQAIGLRLQHILQNDSDMRTRDAAYDALLKLNVAPVD